MKNKKYKNLFDFIVLLALTAFSIWQEFDEIIIVMELALLLGMPIIFIINYPKYTLHAAIFELIFSIFLSGELNDYGIIGLNTTRFLMLYGMFLSILLALKDWLDEQKKRS